MHLAEITKVLTMKIRWHASLGRILVVGTIIFAVTCLRLNGQTGQLRKNPPTFNQHIESAPGQRILPKPLPLPIREPLDFTVQGLIPEALLSPNDARAARETLIKRVNEAQRAITECVLDSAGQRRSTADTLRLLHNAAARSTGALKHDLTNLLVAALVEAKVEDRNGLRKAATFKLWSYRRIDDRGEEQASLCGPTIIAHPNTTLLIPVLNLLNKDDLKLGDFPVQDPIPLSDPADLMNSPHGFDITNLHTHGLNVSPCWPADDVFREIHPGQVKFFIYHIPKDHPAGTFWYHPHKHGGVSTQVSGGMAGALLIKGTPDEPLGLDRIGRDKGWEPEDQPLILQQMTLYQLKKPDPSPVDVEPFIFRPDFFAMKNIVQQENVENVDGIGRLARWMKSSLVSVSPDPQTWLSGRFQPALAPRETGRTYRLRLIHAGIEENWNFLIQRRGATESKEVKIPRIQVIAWDGIPLAEPYEVTPGHRLILSPGNRADVLVWFGKEAEGDYAVINRFGDVEIAGFRVNAGPPREPRFLDPADVKSCTKPPPPRPIGKKMLLKVEWDDTAVKSDANGGAKLVPGIYTINEATFPGFAKHFELNKSCELEMHAEGHPIHFHVNPLYLPPDDSRKSDGLPSCGYYTDTIFVHPKQIGIMGFENWTGKTVVHCHILDHEDNGMMNVFDIRRGIGFPIAPLPGVLDTPRLPDAVRALMKPVWPRKKAALRDAKGLVTVYAFLPRTGASPSCLHCVNSVSSIAALRKKGQPTQPFRIVAITGPNIDGAEGLAQSLSLDPRTDELCLDSNLTVFQAFALIDGNPVFNAAKDRYTFPDSLDPDGVIKHDSDVMHGLFVVTPEQFVVSTYRGFRALDDTAQTLSEIRLASDLRKWLLAHEKQVEAWTAENVRQRLEKLNIERFKARIDEFRRSLE